MEDEPTETSTVVMAVMCMIVHVLWMVALHWENH